MIKKILIVIVIISIFIFVGHLFSNRYDAEIMIVDGAYDPSSISIEKGMTVRWTNIDDKPHTVNSPFFDSETISPGENFDYRFKESGVFIYVCAFHKEIRGVITVN